MSTRTVATSLPTGTWQIETSHSHAGFSVRHAGIAKVRGSVDITGGTIVVGDTLAETSVTATLDPATVDTRDAGRNGHLTSADFFDVENHPTWTFASTSVEEGGEGLLVHGDLTIRGVTQPVTLDVELNGAATDPFGNARVGFSATTKISRKDFGLTWNAALETGGVLVGDAITITLEIEGVSA
jgi:polyisoprenoid-binding protein YceI